MADKSLESLAAGDLQAFSDSVNFPRHIGIESNQQPPNDISKAHGPAVGDQIQQPKESRNKKFHRAFRACRTKGSQTP